MQIKSSYSGTQKSELIDGIIKISKERLSESQKLMLLEILCVDGIFNSTRFVCGFSDKFGRSKSGVWECLNSLKRIGLVEASSLKADGRWLRLTKLGKIVAGGSNFVSENVERKDRYKL